MVFLFLPLHVPVKMESMKSSPVIQRVKATPVANESTEDMAHRIIELINSSEERYPDSTFNVKRIEDVLRLWPVDRNDPEEIAEYLIERFRATGKKMPEPKEHTQLDAVVDYLADVAKKHGLQNQQKLWMPVLPDTLYLDDLEGYRDASFRNGTWCDHGNEYRLSAHLGMVDAPEVQRQFPLIVDFAQNGHLAIAGGVSSGKSTLMQTLFHSLMSTYSPAELNLYLIDFSSQMLSPFEKAPHVGGVVMEGEDDRLDKLFGLLSAILKDRKQQIRGVSFSQYIQMNGHVLPAIIIGLDGYANFREKTGDRFESNIMELLRDAEGYGIYMVISCGGFGGIELQSKLADKMRQGLCLEMGDKFKYAEVLRMSRFDVLPEANTKGRGLAMVDDNVLEYQTAPVNAENDYKRAEGIEAACVEAARAWTGKPARRIPEIPKKPTWALFRQSESYESAKNDPGKLPVAYRQEDASAYCIDLTRGFCYLLLGQEQSGKSVFLRNAACAAADKGAKIYLIDREDQSEKNLDGMTLSQALQVENGPLNVERCASIAMDVCDALESIHMEKILHRDVSPDNIMLCKDGTVKLFDFGAARFSSDAAEDSKVTVIVKPGFAPPEQYDKINQQDARTDIYALGATLYYAMTGVKPEESTDRKIKDNLRSPRSMFPEIPEYIDNAIMRAMSLEPQFRFESAEEFRKVIQQRIKVASLKKERQKRIRRRMLGIGAAAMAVVVAALMFWFNWEKKQNTSILPDGSIELWYMTTGNEDWDGVYNLSTVVTHKTSDWSVIALEKPVPFIWIKAVRRLDAVEVFYSFDDKTYTMMRNAWMQDNTPMMVGVMGACPDGDGFNVKFENFKVKHLPDMRRLKWLKENSN